MAIQVKHSKVSTIPDGDDSSLVRPSDWNADHTLVGTIDVANGGTGASTADGALTNLLPSQTGNNGKFLSTNGTTTLWSSPASSGDVVGPASATDNAITRYDGTTGKLIQNSTVTLDDNGNIINANSVGFDTTPATLPTTAGTMSWDDGEGMPEVILKGGNVTLKIGSQEYARVYNDSGSILTKGQAVYISGAQGNRIAVKLARANLEATSYGTLGLVAETIAIGAEGYIIVSGALYKLNTLGLTAGATVYLSPTTAGAVTTTKPQAPDQLVVIGFVERVDNTVGSIYVKVDNGYELDELHDVRITSPQSGNLLIYDATTSPIGVWKNANLTDGTGISITEGAGSVTVAIDSTVATLTGSQVLTNKTISVDDNTVSGIAASSFVLSNASGNIDGAAAQKAIPSGTVVGTTDTQTLTNKRITPRVSTTTSSATPTINTDNVDVFGLTAQTVDITSFTTNLSGTPTDGQRLMIYIVGTAARAITWGASFEASTVPLPTTTVSTNRLDVGFVWNAATSKWRCVATA